MTEKNIIFYDGECALCHFWVQFVLNHDPNAVFHFASLQSAVAKQMLSASLETPIDSIVVKMGNEVFVEFQAIQIILRNLALPGFLRILHWGVQKTPRLFGNVLYRMIAGIRKKIFQKPPSLCPLIPTSVKNRFL